VERECGIDHKATQYPGTRYNAHNRYLRLKIKKNLIDALPALISYNELQSYEVKF